MAPTHSEALKCHTCYMLPLQNYQAFRASLQNSPKQIPCRQRLPAAWPVTLPSLGQRDIFLCRRLHVQAQRKQQLKRPGMISLVIKHALRVTWHV